MCIKHGVNGPRSAIFSSSHAVELTDAAIAATAEHYGLPLATLNRRHFPMFPRLKPAY